VGWPLERVPAPLPLAALLLVALRQAY